MAFSYAKIAKAAKDQIADKGRSVTISRGGDDFDPSTGIMGGTATTTVVKAVVSGFKTHQIDGTVIKAGDKMFLIAADGLTIKPDESDKIVDGAETYQVQNVEAVQPGDTALLYKVQARA